MLWSGGKFQPDISEISKEIPTIFTKINKL